MLKKTLMVSIAINLSLLAGGVVSLGRHVVDVPGPSSQALAKVMQPMHVDSGWIKSGSPRFMAVESAVINAPMGSVSTGLWSCDGPAIFEWTYWSDETVHILEGAARIAYLGKDFELKPGDTAFFRAGTKATWVVPDRVSKSFVLHDPGLLSRLYRRIAI